MFAQIDTRWISFCSRELWLTGIIGRRVKPCQLYSKIWVPVFTDVKTNKCKYVQSGLSSNLYGNRHYHGFNPWEDSSWQRVHCACAANGVKERQEICSTAAAERALTKCRLSGSTQVLLFFLFRNFQSFPCSTISKFLSYFPICSILQGAWYKPATRQHKLPEIILTTFIRFSWSPFWCLAFFSLNEKDIWTVTTDYANIQMPIINRPYTPAGNRTVIHSNIENRITENYYRDWYDLCTRSPSRQGGDKHIWRGKTNTHNPFSPSV